MIQDAPPRLKAFEEFLELSPASPGIISVSADIKRLTAIINFGVGVFAMPQIRKRTVRREISPLRLLSATLGIAALLAFAGRAPAQDAPAGPIPGATPSDQPVSTHGGAQNSNTSESHPNLAGTWKLNKDQSDDPRQKMQEAAAQQGGGGRGGWGGGGGGGMGAGQRGAGQGGGQRGGMMQDYSELTITQTNATTQVTGDSGRVLASTDNSAGNSPTAGSNNSADSDANRNSPPAAQWQGSQLVVTEQMRRGTTTRTYELSPDGKQLYVTTKIDNPRFSQPVTIRFVYDPVKQGG
jgi:hypothetical protein